MQKTHIPHLTHVTIVAAVCETEQSQTKMLHLSRHQVEVLPELVHVNQVGVLALALSSCLLLLLLSLLPLLVGSGFALLLLPLAHICAGLLGHRRVQVIRGAGHLQPTALLTCMWLT